MCSVAVSQLTVRAYGKTKLLEGHGICMIKYGGRTCYIDDIPVRRLQQFIELYAMSLMGRNIMPIGLIVFANRPMGYIKTAVLDVLAELKVIVK